MKDKNKIGLRKRAIKSDREINKKNKKLIIEKILSYNPMLVKGIDAYKDASKDFALLIFLVALLINYPVISIPCCMLSIFFLMKMLQYIRYKSIDNIVNKLAKDLSFRGIYDKEKAEDMIDDFKFKYGEETIEYEELVKMLEKYEIFVTRIEHALKGVGDKREKSLKNNEELFIKTKDGNITYKQKEEGKYINEEINSYCRSINEKNEVFYKKEDGDIKKVNKAIEFFEDKNESDKSYNGQEAVVLRNVNKDNKNLTIYLYKKSSNLQKNAL